MTEKFGAIKNNKRNWRLDGGCLPAVCFATNGYFSSWRPGYGKRIERSEPIAQRNKTGRTTENSREVETLSLHCYNASLALLYSEKRNKILIRLSHSAYSKLSLLYLLSSHLSPLSVPLSMSNRSQLKCNGS